ncbi:MAG: efflux RND transporter permease subunit [Candidatus Marinimicrobia bacterium]|nr:efflux RND transporter permease subunit [Candidatus Neomarinimicrobiota bacterium]MCF7905308.1 efflux RND transporter permease subunit [Candidatus Neomarinimicrobiota bacterium]
MKISKQAIDHPMGVIFASLGIFLASVAAYMILPLELVPRIEIPYAFVSATYIGAAPSEIETEIIKPIEDKLSQLQDVEEINGYAMQNAGFITVKFSADADLESSIDELKEKVNEALPELRDEVENVTVRDVDITDTPISILNIYGEFSPHELRSQAEIIKDKLTRVPGVNQVEMFGGEEREISVELDPDLLVANNLSMPQVLMALQRNNLNFPGGTIKLKGQDIFIRTVGKFAKIEDIENTILGVDQSGNIKRIKDVGTVIDGFEIPSSYSRYQSQNSVTLLISKRTGAHIVEATEEIEAVVNASALKFPEGMEFAYTARQATDIETQNSQLNKNAMWGIIFVILVLFAGIGFKNALIVSLALPFALMSSFPLMYLFEVDRTGISMFGLIIVLGIVVDGAIIIAESTYRHMEEGLSRRDAAIMAVDEVGVPIMTAVLTTMVAFAPIIYMSGTMGQFLSVIPKVVIFTLVGAFLADHFLIPVLASKIMSVTKRAGVLSGEWVGKRIYTKIVGWSLNHRWTVVFSAIFTFFLSIAIVGISAVSDLKLVKLQIFPNVPRPRIILDINTPAGSQLEYTDQVVRDIERYLQSIEEVDRYVSTVGESGVQNLRTAQGGGKGAEIAQINVDLVDATQRDRSVDDLIEIMGAEFAKMPGIDISIETIQEGPPVSSNVIIDVSGDDLAAISFVSDQIKNKLQTVEGAVNVVSSLGVRRTEFQAKVDHDRAASYGLSSQDVSNTLAAAMIGMEATTYTDGLEDIPVVVRLDVDEDDAVQAIQNLNVMNQRGQMVPFQNVATLELGSAETLIKHKDFKRNISVSCDMAKGSDVTDIHRRMDPFLEGLTIPNGVTVEYGGIEDEASKSFASLGRAMIIGFIIIMIILSAQFQSVIQPFIIALAIPLSFIGVIFGLMVTRVPFGIMAFFGVVALMGVVVNDAIVLIAYVNDLRREGMLIREALIKAGRNRLRPIILTTVTTLAGMIPLSLNLAGGAEYWRPLAVSLIFGLAISSFLTLVIVPVLYSLLESRGERKLLEKKGRT